MIYEKTMSLPRGAMILSEDEMRFVEGGKGLTKGQKRAAYKAMRDTKAPKWLRDATYSVLMGWMPWGRIGNYLKKYL